MHKNKTSFLGKLHKRKINTILNKILADLLFGALKWRVSLVSAPQAPIYCECQYFRLYSIENRKGRRLPALPIIFIHLLKNLKLEKVLLILLHYLSFDHILYYVQLCILIKNIRLHLFHNL